MSRGVVGAPAKGDFRLRAGCKSPKEGVHGATHSAGTSTTTAQAPPTIGWASHVHSRMRGSALGKIQSS